MTWADVIGATLAWSGIAVVGFCMLTMVIYVFVGCLWIWWMGFKRLGQWLGIIAPSHKPLDPPSPLSRMAQINPCETLLLSRAFVLLG